MKKLILLTCLAIGFGFSLKAQLRNNDVYEVTEMDVARVRTEIRIPDIAGFKTLKCDLHIHTLFSDGKVWPDIRVNEAWQHGLDAVAITDHIEYRPNKNVVLGDLNESYKIAKEAGDLIGFIVIKGVEITRDKPLGHLNALFIQDAIPFDVKDPLDAIDEAKKQGAFIMWNHPGWPDDKSTLYPVHEKLIKEKKINGIEVFNSTEYYPVAFDWCKDMKLAFMGNSDGHNLIVGDYGTYLRPMTLVFATERSESAIREALFAGRSAAFFYGELAGRPEHLTSLVLESLQVRHINNRFVEVTNNSDISYRIISGKQLLLFPAGKTVLMGKLKEGELTVTNCHVGMNSKLTIPVADFFNR